MERMNSISQPEPEVLTIDGLNVEITPKDDGMVSVKLPDEFDSMTDDQKLSFKAKLEEGSKTIGTYYRKLKETNEKQKSLREQEEDLRKREENLKRQEETLKSGGGTQRNSDDEVKPIWKRLGLQSEADEEDYMVDHPVEYNRALREHLRDEAKAEVNKSLREIENNARLEARATILESQIRKAGVDPADVMAFAKEYNMPFSEKTYQVYARYHSIKSDPIADATIESQRKHIQYIEPSGNRDVESLIHKMRTNEESLTPEERAILRKIARPT